MVILLCDLNIEGRAFATGERVTLSLESEKLLVRKGFAEYDLIDDIHGGGGQLPDIAGMQGLSQSGQRKRGRPNKHPVKRGRKPN